jgi:two-component system sensor histidine kinase DesK
MVTMESSAQARVSRTGGGSPWLAGLVYVLFVFVGPVLRGGWLQWALTLASVAAFVFVYLDFFHNRLRLRRARIDLGSMAALGFGLLPFNLGAATYIVFSAAFAAFVLPPRWTLGFLLTLAIGAAAEMSLLADPDRLVIGWVVFLILVIGIGNLFLDDRLRQSMLILRAQEDIEELAKVAERERIARDLHDVLGHTLSVIALKSALAVRLAANDPHRAVEEIREVEQVARDALVEVRRAVEGYRGSGLSGELRKAAEALGSAGVRFETEVVAAELSPRHETVLALALREAVTNVIRHAHASVCRVELRENHSRLVLTVYDDGVGGVPEEGFGLTGMRERVAAARGSLTIEGTRGMLITISLPTAAAALEAASSP